MAFAVSPQYRTPGALSANAPSVKLTARIVEWSLARDEGVLLFEKHRVPVSGEEFIIRHKRPEVGDVIEFRLGRDPQGRMVAQDVEHHNDGGRIRLRHLFALAVMLVAPGFALWQLAGRNDWRLVAGITLGISVITFLLYWLDKLRARHGQWRVAETTLHLAAFLGGWPGAYLAQKHFRHKASKNRFLLLFWLVVTVHQFAAFDYLQDWQALRAANEAFKGATMSAPAAKQ